MQRRHETREQMVALQQRLEVSTCSERTELGQELETLQANWDFVQESIADCQKAIVQVEDGGKVRWRMAEFGPWSVPISNRKFRMKMD